MNSIKNGSECTQNAQIEGLVIDQPNNENSEMNSSMVETKPLVNIWGSFYNDYREFNCFEMTVTYEMLREFVLKKMSQPKKKKNSNYDPYKELVYNFYKPLRDIVDIKSSILDYITKDKGVNDLILSNTNGGFSIEALIHVLEPGVSEVTCEVVVKDNPEFKEYFQSLKFKPLAKLNDSDFAFSTVTLLKLIHVNYYVFLLRMVDFLRNKSTDSYEFTDNQLFSFLDKRDHEIKHIMDHCLEVLEYYHLIKREFKKSRSGKIHEIITVLNMEDYDDIFKIIKSRR
jgi:hypothetical protein